MQAGDHLKRIIVVVALIALVSSGIIYWFGQPTASAQPVPKKANQEITLYYSQMDVGMAESLGCVSAGTGWLCYLTGAGGGHAYKD